MTKIKGNSYYLIIRILFFLLPPFLIGYIISQPNTPDKGFYGGILLISLFLVFILKSLKDLVVVKFNDYNMSITYLIIQKKIDVPYSNLLNWKCIDGHRGQHYNVIKFKTDNFLGTSKIRVDRIVDGDKFIPFVKWLKTKNDKIEFKITPSDSKLIKPFNKEFGIENKIPTKK